MASIPFKEKVLRTIGPAQLIALGVYQFVLTIIDIVFVQHEPGKLFQFSKLRNHAFARFWNAYGAFLSSRPSPEVLSLLQTVRGTVLDLGPGSGDLLKYLSPSALTRVYGAEPAQLLHGKLRAHARDAGLEGKYSVLHCGAEPESLIPALAKAGVLSGAGEGVFDEICCVRVLCGVPRPAETVRGLYGLLKPGGRMVVHEHVVNPWREEDGSVASRVLQAVYSWVGWDFFLGCKIDRDTKALLLEAGGKDGWSKVELKSLMGWSVMPHCTGYLVKRE